MYIVALYEQSLGYGGPEEGGWWYDKGECVRVVAASYNEDVAHAKAKRCNDLLECLQRNKRPVSSAAYSGGRHCARVFHNAVPQYYPEVTPHYE